MSNNFNFKIKKSEGVINVRKILLSFIVLFLLSGCFNNKMQDEDNKNINFANTFHAGQRPERWQCASIRNQRTQNSGRWDEHG